MILPYRHGPGDEGEFLMEAEQDHEEEDGGEDPQSDGHKHHPTVCRHPRVGGAGYQRPVEQTQKLEQRQNRPTQKKKKRNSL